MKINKKTDLAIRILKYLNSKNDNNYISGNLISQELGISYNHLRRIVPLLNELGYTTSKQGKDGGICLSESAQDISLETLLLKTELADGCINDCENCVFNKNCTFEKHTRNAVLLFCSYFKDVYLKDL